MAGRGGDATAVAPRAPARPEIGGFRRGIGIFFFFPGEKRREGNREISGRGRGGRKAKAITLTRSARSDTGRRTRATGGRAEPRTWCLIGRASFWFGFSAFFFFSLPSDSDGPLLFVGSLCVFFFFVALLCQFIFPFGLCKRKKDFSGTRPGEKLFDILARGLPRLTPSLRKWSSTGFSLLLVFKTRVEHVTVTTLH